MQFRTSNARRTPARKGRPLLRAAALALMAAGATAASEASATVTVGDDPVLFWNEVALAHLPGSAPVQTRAYAMLNIAMHDAVNAASGKPNHSYLAGVAQSGGDTRAAASVAARNVLVALNPSKTAEFDAALSASLALIADGQAKSVGMATGAAYAMAMLTARTGDGSTASVTYTPSGQPGGWAPTPPNNTPAGLPHWGGVDPFLMSSGDQFRPGPPPALDSAEYAAAYNELKQIGALNSATRTADQTASAIFWNPSNGATWLRIGVDTAADEGLSTLDNARLFAMLSAAAADTQIAGFDAKYTHDFWRPVTAIRAGDLDGNPLTLGDPTWTPLNAAPAHPSYISTLSALSAASATILLDLLGDEAFCSTMGANTRCWSSFQDAMLDAANSRLWGGIHWRFDSQAGLQMGEQIAARGLGGRAFNAVPEPSTWGLMIVGFGLMGAAIRRRAKPACVTA